MIKILSSALIALLALTGCADRNANATPNNGIVKDCAEIKVDKQVTQGISLWCVDRSKGDVIQESLRGPMLVNVYGSWCAPCRDEMPFFREFYKKYQKEVQLIGIAVEEARPEDTQSFIKEIGINWPSLYDPDGRTRTDTGLKIGIGVPITVFIDANGKVVGRIVGAVKDLETLVAKSNQYLNLNLR